MDEQYSALQLKLIELEGKIDAVYGSVEKTRKYMLWTGIITAAVIIIPLIVLPFMLPSFFASQGVPSSVDLNSILQAQQL